MAFALAGNVITQSGTDANPEGLSAIAGVTTINQGNATTKRIVFDLGTLQLNIAGDLTHDPDVYEIIGNIQNGIQVVTGADYKLGIERTVNGRKSYSKGTGLVSTFQGNFFNQFGIVLSGGTMTWNGGVMRTTGAVSHSGCAVTSNTFDSVWQVVGISGQWRSTGVPDFKGITMQGINADCVLFLLSGFTNLSINFERAFYQSPASGGPTRTIENAVFANNQASLDAVTNQSVGVQQTTIIKNPDVIPRLGKLSNNAYADFPVVQSLLFDLSDASGTSAENAVAYIADSDNGDRKNATANGLPGGTVTSDYVTDRKYIAASGSNGVAELGDILTLVAIHNNLTDGTMNLDFRSNYGNNSVDFNVFLGGYDYLNTVTRQSLIGNGGTSVPWTLFEDLSVTMSRADALNKLASSLSVDPVAKTVTVTANADYDELFDALKAYKYNGQVSNFETPTPNTLILTPNGQELNAAANWTLVVNSGVTLSAGTKFRLVRFSTITLNGAITGVYASDDGTSTAWTFQGVEAGSSVAVWDSAGVTKLYQQVTVDGDYTLFIPPGVTGTYNFAVEKYGFAREFGDFPANAGGDLFYVPRYVEDVGITETDLATVLAYTEINTGSKFYDRTAAFRLTEQGIKLGQIATRSGFAIEIGLFSVVVDQNASNIYSLNGSTITIKATAIEGDLRYDTIIATPPATITAADNELILIAIEDANGDSSIDILGGDGNFELWKVPTSTATADYETGEKLGDFINERFRFIGIAGFDIVGVDILSNVRRRTSMAKGVYTQAFYVGDQIQLAQAPQVNQTLEQVQILKVDIDAVKGQGFGTNQHSLVSLKKHVTAASQF